MYWRLALWNDAAWKAVSAGMLSTILRVGQYMGGAVRAWPSESEAAAGIAQPTHSLPADEPLLMRAKIASGNAVRFGQFDRRLQGKHHYVGAGLGCRPMCATATYRLANDAPSNGIG
jgi:hypothetical protein